MKKEKQKFRIKKTIKVKSRGEIVSKKLSNQTAKA